MDNRSLLTLIVIVLITILAVMSYQAHRRAHPETPGKVISEAIDKAHDDINEVSYTP